MATRTKKSASEDAEQTVKPNSAAAKNTNPNVESTNGQNDKQSQLATILVGLLIIASGLLIYNYFQKSSTPDTTTQSEQQQEEENKNQAKNEDKNSDKDSEEDSDSKEGEYTVVAGDSLWSIAEKAYGNGFDWTKIRDANDLQVNAAGESTVEIGQVLNIPDSAAVAQQSAEDKDDVVASNNNSDVAGVQEIRETPATAIQTYTVQHGDTLWSIAENVYGDGHQWTVINNDPHNQIGQLPDGTPLVHSGNVLYIPELLQ